MQRRTISAKRTGLYAVPILMTILSLFAVTAPAAANEKYAAIVVDANTGKTLYEDSADEKRYPASLTKMMTLYLLFEELEAKKLSLSSPLSVSKNAAAQAPSKLGLRAGSKIEVEDAILALTTKSANDASVVVAENVSGSVSNFAQRMTRTARKLGMNQSTFRNPNGLPNSSQFTSARDMAKLGAALQDRFPQYYKFFSARSFTYKGKKMRNHNRLLGSVTGVDGIKTGYTRASGFNLVSNVKRDGRHIIAVVLGGRTAASRDAHMRDLIARHLPSAKKGSGNKPLLVADAAPAPEVPAQEPEPAEALELVAAAAVDPDARLPRPRPGSEAEQVAAAAPVANEAEVEAPLVAYAPTSAPRDLVSAAMAQSATPAAVDRRKPADLAQDPVSARIAAATEVAEVAQSELQDAAERLARLTQVAKARSGTGDMIAAPRAGKVRTSDPEAGEAGWHIQIGAVPTIEGAHELIERAQSSMGPVLASRHALTQEVAKNGTTLYRARFAGFVGKDEARDACNKLKSKSFSCLAVRN